MADEAPYIIVKKSRPGGGEYKRSIRVARVWRHKETGNYVEVVTVHNVVPDNYLRVVFFDPTIGRQLSMPLRSRKHPFPKPGAATIEMEPGFEDHYEIAPDQRSTRV